LVEDSTPIIRIGAPPVDPRERHVYGSR
jgi:hypothetical protein